MYSLMADKPTEIQAYRDTGAYKKMIYYSPACNTCVYVCACVCIRSCVVVFPCAAAHVMCLQCFKTYCSIRLRERQFVHNVQFGYTLPCPGNHCNTHWTFEK